MEKKEINIDKIKPFIKWVGGKGQTIEKIFENFPNTISDYYEPFVGGGAILIELLKRLFKKQILLEGSIYINDVNNDLINVYKMIKNNVKYLLIELDKIEKNYTKAPSINYPKRHIFSIDLNEPIENVITKGKQYLYFYYRTKYNNINITNEEKAILFIFLNKAGFRGLYRVGKNGFNVPFGNYDKIQFYEKNNLLALNLLFNKYNVIFSSCDYNEIFINSFKSNTFVYLDPPYYPVKNSSFVNYEKNGFNTNEHLKLLELCKHLDTKKVKFLQSNSFCEFNKNSYSQFNIETIVSKRRINSINPKQIDSELLISN
uniref:site-specific DNA-methyltransferase (adenine-specific) n=1 Tax=viral metagenome TaxID=1070528 RepID=A0A6C0JFR5_9ZZZZ